MTWWEITIVHNRCNARVEFTLLDNEAPERSYEVGDILRDHQCPRDLEDSLLAGIEVLGAVRERFTE